MKTHTVVVLYLFLARCQAQKVDACPGYACNPRGTFSYLLNGPNSTDSAYVAWVTDRFIGPIPEPLGCVGNSNNIVCQSNGPGRDVGYISFDVTTGKVEWIDGLLRFPVLPVMDIYGDIIGTDGHYLVEYQDSGKLEPPISFSDFIYPVYSLLMTENSIVMIVSKNGVVVGYGSDGVVLGAIWLNGTVERANGTFIPVAQPILNENRVYILTEFKPNDDSLQFARPSVLGLQRLYAIDIFERMVDRLHITWYFNFERESQSYDKLGLKTNTGSDPNVVYMEQDLPLPVQDIDLHPSIMYNVETETVMVNLPPPYYNPSNAERTLWGIQDQGDTAALSFRVTMSLRSLSMFDTSYPYVKQGTSDKWPTKLQLGQLTVGSAKRVVDRSYVWGLTSTRDGILRINPSSGVVEESVGVAELVNAKKVNITSALMVSRKTMGSDDVLVFGMKVFEPKPDGFVEICNRHHVSANNTAFVVGVRALPSVSLLWMVPTPEDMEVKGQIAGIPLTESNGLNDILVVFVGNDEASKVFAISSK